MSFLWGVFSKRRKNSVSSVLKTLINENGSLVLKNHKLVKAYLMDCVQGQDREKKMIDFAFNVGVQNVFVDFMNATYIELQKTLIFKCIKLLKDDALMSEENAHKTILILLEAVNKSNDFKEIFFVNQDISQKMVLTNDSDSILYSLKITNAPDTINTGCIQYVLLKHISIQHLWNDVFASLPIVVLNNLEYSVAIELEKRLQSYGCIIILIKQDSPISLRNVILTHIDAYQKLLTIKLFRECTGLGLADAKYKIEHCPSSITENVSEDIANVIKNKLSKAGAQVKIL